MALGSVSRIFPIPGLIEHAIGFKTIAEATALRNRIVRHLELAEGLDDEERGREYLSFVFVGGGYAGLEGIAELAGFARDALKRYPRCRETGSALHAGRRRRRGSCRRSSRSWPTTPSSCWRKRGIEFRLETTVSEVREDCVHALRRRGAAGRTVVWTAGVRASPVAAASACRSSAGASSATSTMRVRGLRERLGAR